MTLFLEEKQGCDARALKRELTRLKNKRLRMLEHGEVFGLKKVENSIKSIRWRLGRTNERKIIHATDLTDIEHLRINHTYDEYVQLKASGAKRIHVLWGVSWGELARWKKEEEKKMAETLNVQAMSAEEIAAYNFGQQQKMQAEVEMVRENFQRVQKELKNAQDMLHRANVRVATREATIRELEQEVDVYAEMVGELEYYKKLAQLAAKHFVGEVSDAAYTKAIAELAMYQVTEG